MGGKSSKLKEAEAQNLSASVVGKQALVFGGTSGIGQAVAQRLAAGGCSVTIVGRNAEQGAAIVEAMKQAAPEAATPAPAFDFLRADVSLMDNCVDVANRFKTAPATTRLDYVVYCQTKATLQGRTPTADGIDEKLALNYYSRVFLTELLAPLLAKTASEPSLVPPGDVRVMSVLAAGKHSPYAHWKTDPYIKDHYGAKAAADAATFYNDLWADFTSTQHGVLGGKVCVQHVYPGFVNTNWGTDMPVVVKGLTRCAQAAAARPADACAEYMLRGLLNPAYSRGPRFLGEYGEEVSKTKEHHADAIATVRKDTLAHLAAFKSHFAAEVQAEFAG